MRSSSVRRSAGTLSHAERKLLKLGGKAVMILLQVASSSVMPPAFLNSSVRSLIASMKALTVWSGLKL